MACVGDPEEEAPRLVATVATAAAAVAPVALRSVPAAADLRESMQVAVVLQVDVVLQVAVLFATFAIFSEPPLR